MNIGAEKYYKVRLSSGRVLGPLDIQRIRRLIEAKQITGSESVREYPTGEWAPIGAVEALAELVLAQASGEYTNYVNAKFGHEESSQQGYAELPGKHISVDLMGPTHLVTAIDAEPVPPLELPVPALEPDFSRIIKTYAVGQPTPEGIDNLSRQTDEPTIAGLPEEFEKTVIKEPTPEVPELDRSEEPELEASVELEHVGIEDSPVDRQVAREKTIVFQRSEAQKQLPDSYSGGKRKLTRSELIRVVFIAIGIGILAYEMLFEQGEQVAAPQRWLVEVSKRPNYSAKPSDPQASAKLIKEGLKFYDADTLVAYQEAAARFLKAAEVDKESLTAHALLAMSYINLVDAFTKDENYFKILTELMQNVRAKGFEVPHAVMMDAEYYIMMNKPEAAEMRIVNFSKANKYYQPDSSMFYHLANAYYQRGDTKSASRYISVVPDDKITAPRFFYLRGLIAEQAGDSVAALSEYGKAITAFPAHAKSHLRAAELLARMGRLREAKKSIEYITSKPQLLSPKQLALAYALQSQLLQLENKVPEALGAIERAHTLDKQNFDYRLELYTLRAKAGDTSLSVQKEAKMYYFLSEGERLFRDGQPSEALNRYLQARTAYPEKALPMVKAGDMFLAGNDILNAKENYRQAAVRAPKDAAVLAKYIRSLIMSFEYEETKKALGKFSGLQVKKSDLNKLNGDLYAQQGRYDEALMYYQRALQAGSVDSELYLEYGRALLSAGAKDKLEQAPFYFAMALRFDPLNPEPVVLTAKAMAEADSVEHAISYLHDELKKSGKPKAEFLAAIAELQIRRGDVNLAQQFIDEARQLNPNYALPLKLQGQIYLAKEGQQKDALDKALVAFKQYSSANKSDPSGFLERYKIFLRRAQFENAERELGEVFALFPKWPKLRIYTGQLYFTQGNYQRAAEEFNKELENDKTSVAARLWLGKAYTETGNFTEAQRLITECMAYAPGASEPKSWAGWINYQQKNYPAAAALLEAALSIDKGNSLIYKRLGFVYRAMGDGARAKQSFRKYIEMEPDSPDRAEVERYL